MIFDRKNSEQRIDNFLINKFKNLSKIMIYCLLRKGKIRVNLKRVKPKYKLQFEDKIYTNISSNLKKKLKIILILIKYFF